MVFQGNCPCGELYLSETYGDYNTICCLDGKLCCAVKLSADRDSFVVEDESECERHRNNAKKDTAELVIPPGGCIDITSITREGIFLTIGYTECYLPYSKFPRFKTASIIDVFNVQMTGDDKIRWNALDIELDLSIVENPDLQNEAHP